VIRRIIEHNKLNGVAFSTVEFLLIAAAATFIGVGLGLHGEWSGVVLAAGIALNSLVVVAFAAAAWRRGEPGTSLRHVFDPSYRELLSREHPTIMRDTLILSAAVIVPYVLPITVAAERRRSAG
jgi:hypothetical protein